MFLQIPFSLLHYIMRFFYQHWGTNWLKINSPPGESISIKKIPIIAVTQSNRSLFSEQPKSAAPVPLAPQPPCPSLLPGEGSALTGDAPVCREHLNDCNVMTERPSLGPARWDICHGFVCSENVHKYLSYCVSVALLHVYKTAVPKGKAPSWQHQRLFSLILELWEAWDSPGLPGAAQTRQREHPGGITALSSILSRFKPTHHALFSDKTTNYYSCFVKKAAYVTSTESR